MGKGSANFNRSIVTPGCMGSLPRLVRDDGMVMGRSAPWMFDQVVTS